MLNRSANSTRTSLPHVFIHVGIHKTGTTSFQHFIRKYRSELVSQHCDIYTGIVSPYNHYDLHLISLRKELKTLARLKFQGDLASLERNVKSRISKLIDETKCKKLIFSAEGLSFIRRNAECEMLKSLFPNSINFTILLMLQDKESYLSSRKAQILRNGYSISNDPESAFYVEKDSWLCDFDGLISVLESNFDDVRILQYERGNTIPALLKEIGVEFFAASQPFNMNVTK